MKSQVLILIVDEREENARLLREQLSHGGYRTVHAGKAREATALIERDRPDLILAVDRAGEELVRSLEESRATPDCPIVAVGDREPRRRSPLVTRFLRESASDSQLESAIREFCILPAERGETD